MSPSALTRVQHWHVNHSTCLTQKKHPCLQGEYTRGMSVLDWGGVLNRPANVQVVQRLNCNQLLDLLDQATKEQEE